MTERLGNNNVRVLLRSIAVFASITLAGACLAFFLAGQAQAQTPDVEFAWSKQFGTSANDNARSVAVGADGNVYAAGYTEGSLGGISSGGRDVFVSKHLAADGGPGWTRQLGSASSDDAFDVAADQQGNTYVVGRGDVVNRGTSGGFVVKYDAQGNTNLASTSGNVWAKQFIDGTVRTVAVDPDNNVYISLNINSDVYVYKFAPDGSLIASQPFGAYGCFGTGLLDFAFGSAVGTRSDDPSVYITGTTAGQKLDDPNNCNISTSEDSMFLIKFDGAMNKRWDRQFGGTGGDSTPIDLAVDSENNAYVTGFTPSGGQVRDPSALTGGLQNTLGGRDAFIFKYGSDGTPVYAKQFGTSGDDLARGIVAGPGQVLELTGRTTGSFDPAKPNAGLGDVFMTRRHASDGSDVVTRQFGSAGEDSALSLGYDGTTDNLVMAGITDGSLFGQNAGGQDAFVAKVGYAPDADPSDNFGSNSTGDAGSNPSDVGDPVNVTTGNVYDVREDLNISGKGLPLQFVRTYNSQDTIRKPLGYGWTHSYNTTLVENADGSVTELAPDGKRLVFTKNADTSFTAPKGVQDILTKAQDGTYKLAKKNGMEWHFANGGKLQKISDPNGNALLFSYDASSGRLSRITDSSGRDSLLEYDTSGRLTKVTDPAGRTVSYGYDPAGNLATVTDQASKVTSYEYDADHNLTKITNPDGGTTSFSYDAQDRAISSQSDGGHQKVTLSYEPASSRTLVTDSKGNQSTYSYDSDEQVTKIVDPYGKEISYAWDAKGNKTSETDQLGNTTSYEYDAKGNLTKMVQPKPTAAAPTNPTWTLTYEPTFSRVTSVTDPEGGVTRFSYDARGNLTESTDALGNKTTYAYDASGQLIKSVDPKGNATTTDPNDGVTTFAYDTLGNVTGVTDPAGKTTNLAYGAPTSKESVLSLPSSVTDALNRTTDLTYDALGRVSKVTNPLTPPDTARTSVSLTYDGTGDLTSMTDERGNKTTYAYDALGQLQKITDPLLKATTYAYDTEGNLISETDPAGNKSTYDYDALTRLVKVSSPDGTTNADGTPGAVVDSYAYDAAGRPTSHTDPKGFTTTFGYDALGNLTGVSDLKSDGTTIASASYGYDLLGRMTKATNPNGNATSYSYDKVGNLLKETDPLGNFYSYAYEENGNLKSRTDALNRTTNYSYDPLNRPLSATYPNGTKVQMTYDAVGNLLSATDETGTYSYSYDERNRVLKETFPGNQILQHGYDATSNPTSLTYPDGVKALYEYDGANRLTAVTDRAGAKSTYTYNSRDLLTKVSYPNGAGDAYTYDALGRVTQAKATGTNSTGGATTLASLSYAYDKNSNPTSITDKASNQSTFTYDALDRLTKEVHPGKTLSYTYDAAGNRKSLTSTTTTTTTTNYTYNAAERMTKAGATTFTYNKNGVMTSKTEGTTTTNYTYDFEGALTKAATKTYARDPFGRAISSTVGTTKTDYLFDGAEAIQQKTGTTATTYYTRGLGGQLINRRGGGNPLRYYHHDAIGSVVGLTDSTGALTDTYSYTAFGEVRARTGTNTQPFQYLGNLYDSDSKLLDFHARSYDPAVGRFTSKDPVAGFGEAPQSLNPYSYGYNGPLAYPDPYGQCPICVAAAPVIGRVAAAGKVVAVDAATNATISAGGYYLNHRAEKDEIDWAEFRRTVGQETLDQTLSDFKNPLNFLPTRKLQRAAEVLKFADKASDASRLLKKARQVSGRFPRTAGPGETLVRRDPTTGVPTNYQVYGRDGLPIKRVDLTGRAHGNVSTPHVVEYERHKNPNTGEVFVRASRTVRPAEPGEIP